MAKKPARAAEKDAPIAEASAPVPVPVSGEIISAGSVQFVWAGNDCTMIFSRPRPAVIPAGKGVAKHVGLQEPVALIQCSAATMKDISVLLPEVVQAYEKQFGPIETNFTKGRAAKKKAPTKH